MTDEQGTQRPLLDEINEISTDSNSKKCTVTQILEELSPEDREGLLVAFTKPHIRGTHISAALKKRGFTVSSHTVQRHRRRACSCVSAPMRELGTPMKELEA